MIEVSSHYINTNQPPQHATEVLSAQPIGAYYSVENELSFIKTKGEFESEHEKEFYLKENVTRFLQEFVGKIPFTEIRYLVKNGRLYYPGIAKPIADSYFKTAQLQGKKSREWSEYIGFSHVENNLVSNSSASSFWVSPPSPNYETRDGLERKFGEYGFVFAFAQNDGVVTNYVLRYPENSISIERSNNILSRLTGHVSSEIDEKVILEQPVSFAHTDTTSHGMLTQFRALGLLDDEAITQSERFNAVLSELTPMTTRYTTLLLGLQDLDPNHDEPHYNKVLQEAKTTLKALYNRAQELKNRHKSPNFAIPSSNYSDEYEMRMMILHYGEKEALIIGGGSCPSVSSTASSDLLLLTKGRVTFENADKLQNIGFNCPNCDAYIARGNGDTCPHCGITKQQHAKQTKSQACD